MDTKKIGAFLKQCRKEKNLTQEQLAEKFGVSSRTVSRWETGSNMPDLSILVELADYYDMDLKELLDGERSQPMNQEMRETLDKVADYEEWVKQKALKAGNVAFASMFMICVAAYSFWQPLIFDWYWVRRSVPWWAALCMPLSWYIMGSGRKDYPSGRQSGETALPA